MQSMRADRCKLERILIRSKEILYSFHYALFHNVMNHFAIYKGKVVCADENSLAVFCLTCEIVEYDFCVFFVKVTCRFVGYDKLGS